MPPIFAIPGPSHLESVLLRVAAQPQGHDLLGRVRIYPPTSRGNVWTGSEPLYLDLAVEDPSQRERLHLQLAGMGCKWHDKPPADLSERQSKTLEKFLRSLRLQSGTDTQPGRRELILAYFGTDREAILSALRSVPRDLEGTIELREVQPAQGSSEGLPRLLLRLPESPRASRQAFAWEHWLVWENRRLGGHQEGRPPQVRLLVQQSLESDTQVYIEHGFRHPIRQLGLVYPNREQAHLLLLWCDRQTEHPVTCWAALAAPQAAGTHIAGSDFHLEFDPPQELAVGVVVVPESPVPVPWRLTHLSSDRQTQLQRLEQRAEGLRRNLHAVETERLALLGRDTRRCRWLLRLYQPARREQACEAYRRFLESTWDRQDGWDYVFQKTGPEGEGWHTVTSRDLLNEHLVPVALADESYYQPATWNDFPALFLRRDCEASLPLDADQARQLAQCLTLELQRRNVPAEGTTLLLAPAENGVRALVLPLHNPATPRARLELLNLDFPQSIDAARTSASESARRQLAESRHQAETDIARLEETLNDEIDARLKSLRTLWQCITGPIDEQATQVQQAIERSHLLCLMTSDFATTWDDFLVWIETITRELIASMLEALQGLAASVVRWVSIYADIQTSQTDVGARLANVEVNIGSLRVAANQRMKQVRAEYDRAKTSEATARAALSAAAEQVETWASECLNAQEKITAGSERLAARTAAVQVLHAAAGSALVCLQEAAAAFDQMVLMLRGMASQLDQILLRLRAAHAEVPRRVAAVEQQRRDAAPLAAALEISVAAALETIDATNEDLAAEEKHAKKLQRQVQEAHTRQKQRQKELDDQLAAINAEIQQVQQKKQHVANLETALTQRERTREEQLQQLRDSIRAVRARVPAIRREIQQDADALAQEAESLEQWLHQLAAGDAALGGHRGIRNRLARAAVAMGQYLPPPEEVSDVLDADYEEERP